MKSEEERRIAAVISKFQGELRTKPKHSGCSLDNFTIRTPAQRTAMNRISKLADRIEEFVANGWNVVLYGKQGTGKDHLMISLMKRAAGIGAECCLMNGQKFMSSVRDNIGNERSERSLIQHYETVPVLGISDVLPERRELGGYNIDMLYLIVNSRWERGLNTLVTLNAKGEADIRRKMGGQIADRLFDRALIVYTDWDSYRKPLDL